MVDMTVEVKTSRDIAQQMLRHWSHRFQEFSTRYAEVTEMEPVQLRRAGATNRQSSEEEFDPMIVGADGTMQKASLVIEYSVIQQQNLYKQLLGAGAAKECARMILPLTMQTTIYAKASARSWFHYLEQRLDKHTQLEHRQVAELIHVIYQKYFPNLSNALKYEKPDQKTTSSETSAQ